MFINDCIYDLILQNVHRKFISQNEWDPIHDEVNSRWMTYKKAEQNIEQKNPEFCTKHNILIHDKINISFFV